MKLSQKLYAAAIAISMAGLVCACGGGGGGSDESDFGNSDAGDFSSANAGAGEIPDNGTRPSESTCKPGVYRKVSTASDSCESTDFEIYEQSGYYAERGFTEEDLFFFEAGEDGLDGNGRTNLLNLTEIEYMGEDHTACLFACQNGSSTIKVSCTAPGKQVCDFTDYARE